MQSNCARTHSNRSNLRTHGVPPNDPLLACSHSASSADLAARNEPFKLASGALARPRAKTNAVVKRLAKRRYADAAAAAHPAPIRLPPFVGLPPRSALGSPPGSKELPRSASAATLLYAPSWHEPPISSTGGAARSSAEERIAPRLPVHIGRLQEKMRSRNGGTRMAQIESAPPAASQVTGTTGGWKSSAGEDKLGSAAWALYPDARRQYLGRRTQLAPRTQSAGRVGPHARVNRGGGGGLRPGSAQPTLAPRGQWTPD